MRTHALKFFAVFCAVFGCLAPLHAQRNLSGTPEIKLALDKLNVLGSVLMIAAHPDDENTAILAYCARGRKVRTGYLSATRGEGGQNLIGSEQGDLLGVIRTQELLAARRIDGAEQFFTRAIDFGFTKTPEETLRKWGRDKILSDMVWVIREFQPDVILLRFSGTPRDGHGQHQASAILGKEAFSAAADPNRFPEQLKLTQIWQAKRLMWNVFSFNAEQEKAAAEMGGRIEVDPGVFDPVLGKSYAEIAGISRSEHRSQGMGAPERRGPSRNFLVTVAGDKATKDLFDGIDITWNRVPGGSGIAPVLVKAAADFVPDHPERTIPLLAQARPAIADLAATKNAWGVRKLAEIDEAIALCAGLWVEAQAERPSMSPGSALKINLSAINRSTVPVNEVQAKVRGLGNEQTVTLAKSLSYNTPIAQTVNITVPAEAGYSQPFWLRKPHVGDAYDIDDQKLIGRADRLPVSQAVFEMNVGPARISTRIILTRPVQYRYVDRVLGEMTRPLAVVPAVAVNLPEPVVVFTHPGTRQIAVQLTSNVRQVSGDVHVTADPGWKVEPASKPFQIAESGEQQELTFAIARDTIGPEKNGPAHFRVSASVGGKEIAAGMQVIAYPHIPPQTIFRPSDGLLRMAPLTVLSKRVGYVMGAGDEVPDSLKQMGCEVRLLSEEDLSRGDLSNFDAIVTGVRAYNVRADLRANQHRLLDYVRNGGRMIVQYNVAEDPRFTGRTSSDLEHMGPYPFKVGRDRVTVEEAPVAFPHPDSRLLQAPNHITPGDFEGWIQERGLYFASEWDPHYETVLESHDPTEKPLPGGMLFTRYGKGSYIFTAYAWFRQLPAGVPGAYRLFANLLSN